MKIKYLISSFLIAIFLLGCTEQKDEPTMQVDSAQTIFDATFSEAKITLTGNVSAITATSDKDWCAVSVNGNIINLNLAENLSLVGRNANITITDGTTVLRVPISQAAMFISTNVNEMEIGLAGGTRILYVVESTFAYTLSLPDDAKDWIEMSAPRNDTIILTIKPTAVRRDADISIHSRGITKQIPIAQGASAIMDIEDGTYTAKAERTYLEVDFDRYMPSEWNGIVETILDTDDPIVALRGFSDFNNIWWGFIVRNDLLYPTVQLQVSTITYGQDRFDVLFSLLLDAGKDAPEDARYFLLIPEDDYAVDYSNGKITFPSVTAQDGKTLQVYAGLSVYLQGRFYGFITDLYEDLEINLQVGEHLKSQSRTADIRPINKINLSGREPIKVDKWTGLRVDR
jgi:hypothetical protein